MPLPASSTSSKQLASLIVLALFLVSAAVAISTATTYDSGDSINHYLYSRYAFQHPANFLESWSKPVFVLLTAGPAQAGFTGIKLFNCLVAALSAWLAYRVAEHLGLTWPWLAALFVYAAPDYFRVQLSGLTEPLFGLVLIAAVWLTLQRHGGWAAVVLSFLPFVRSEGFLLLGVWVVYFGLNRQWRHVPKLLLGYIAYSVAGQLAYGDFLWVFTRNAYPTRVAYYGSGDLTHFLAHLPNILGWVLCCLFWLGGIRIVLAWVRPALRQQPTLFQEELLLIYGSVAVYVGAHSLFWWQGIFGSFGLTRVLNAMVPLLAVIALNGLQLLEKLLEAPRYQQVLYWIVATGVAVFPLTGARTAFHWVNDFAMPADQRVVQQASKWYAAAYPQSHPLVATEFPYVAFALQVDPFDPKQHRNQRFLKTNEPVPVGTLLFWDNWFSVTEGGVSLKQLRQNAYYRLRWQGALPRDQRKPTTDSTRIAVFEYLGRTPSASASNGKTTE